MKNRSIRGSLLANRTSVPGLAALAGVKRDAGDQELLLGEAADALAALLLEAGDLRLLLELLAVGPLRARARSCRSRSWPGPRLPGRAVEGHVAHPEGDRGAADAELLADLLVGPARRPQVARPVLLRDLPSVPHALPYGRAVTGGQSPSR